MMTYPKLQQSIQLQSTYMGQSLQASLPIFVSMTWQRELKIQYFVLSDVLTKDLYVDDQASSVQYEGEAISFVSGLSALLSEGGFHLTKFVSNSKNVVDAIPGSV